MASAERRVHCAEIPHHPGARLAAGFAAEAAILCETAIRLAHGHEHAVFTERAADRGLGPLITALRRPSAPPTLGVSCPAQLVILQLFLVDHHGQIVRPAIPVEGCELPQAQFLAALRHMPWVTVHAPVDGLDRRLTSLQPQ